MAALFVFLKRLLDVVSLVAPIATIVWSVLRGCDPETGEKLDHDA